MTTNDALQICTLEHSQLQFPRGIPRWRSCRDIWLATAPRSWGPPTVDVRRLWSHRFMEVVAGHVGVSISDVAEHLFASKTRPHDRYLLLGTIATTSRSTVFAAVDQLLAREVALKVLHDAEDLTCWRLLAEVQAMTQCDHPNIVRVHEVGDHAGWLYLIMELCDSDIDVWSRGKRWADVLDRLLEAGRGLASVHAVGLVHGDVKPANVLVKGGVAKLGDFGLVTTPGCSGRIVGTPGYIAPEVAEGRQGREGDVFAFACTAWACLFGRPPFGEPPAGADASAATMVLVERVRAREFCEISRDGSGVPSAVTAALRSAMRPDPATRPTLDELLAQLGVLRSGVVGRWRWWRRPVGRA
jgi:serine/threonine protein kinase